MANENNNINELVADDDDPTVELKSPTFSDDEDVLLEVDAKTFDALKSTAEDKSTLVVSELKSELRSRENAVSQLQYDVEQLHAKWLGLETEVGAREEQTAILNADLSTLRESISRKDKLIKKRDGKIKLLKSEIRQRDDEFRQLQAQYDDALASQSETLVTDKAQDADAVSVADDIPADELQRRLKRSEEYADSIRRQFQDFVESNAGQEREIDGLSHAVSESRRKIEHLNNELADAVASLGKTRESLATVETRHAEEIRTLRFELGEAQGTVVETADINNQLASDLLDARGFKDELEIMLGDAEEQSSGRTKKLEKEIRKLKAKAESLEQKLSTKSEAISVLLEELAKKPDRVAPSEDVEEAVQDIDEQPAERVSRVLIGSIDSQVLRFPLFKDRLTIGRTKDNDIQLKAAYVSRRHAVIQTDNEKTRIIDWGSKNGIQVNSAKVGEHFLRHGDIVMIGDAEFRYEELRKRDS